jgi:HlyD family secretion protein
MLQRADIASVLAAEGKRSRTSRFVFIGIGVVLAALAAAGIWFWLSASLRPTTADLQTEVVQRGDIHVTLTATGTLQPLHQAAVTSLTTGTIAAVVVDYNQPVTKGQLLVTLDLRDIEAKLQRSLAMVDVQEANRAMANAAVVDAVAALARMQSLESGSVVSTKDVELAQSALRRAQATLEGADAQVKAAAADLLAIKTDYSKGTITSPIDGVVLDVNAEVGSTIGAASLASPLFTIGSDLRLLDLEIDVDQADVTALAVGRKAQFTVEAAPNHSFTGTIRQVRLAPSITDGVVSYKAIVSVENPDLLLKPGMTATADVSLADATNVLSVPNAALRYRPEGVASSPVSGQRVYVLENGALREVEIGTGLTDGQRTEVTSGDLKVGDTVVTGRKER